MSRLLAAVFLLVLFVDGLPLVPTVSSSCSMPCCKRSGKACCPRLAGSAHGLDKSSAKGCRLSTCDPEAREGVSPRFHDPGVLETASVLIVLPREGSLAAQECLSWSALHHDPPTPPPRISLS
jgi:hypothetical protein